MSLTRAEALQEAQAPGLVHLPEVEGRDGTMIDADHLIGVIYNTQTPKLVMLFSNGSQAGVGFGNDRVLAQRTIALVQDALADKVRRRTISQNHWMRTTGFLQTIAQASEQALNDGLPPESAEE